MKKIRILLSLLFASSIVFGQIPAAFLKNKQVDPNAFIAAVGDIPSGAQTAINNAVNAFKANDLYDAIAFWYPFAPSKTNDKALIEYITASSLATYGDPTTTAPYNTRGSTCQPMGGQILSPADVAASYINMKIKPSQKFNPYEHAIFETITTSLPAASTNFAWGCFKTSPSVVAYTTNLWYSGNVQRAQVYNNTSGQGLYSGTGANGAAGTYWVNATSTFTEGGYNSTVRFSSSTQGGSISSLDIDMYLGTGNNNGSQGVVDPVRISSIIGFKKGLPTVKRDTVVAIMNRYASQMRRTGQTQKLVIDGDSHTVYWKEKYTRILGYDLWQKSQPTEIYSYGVSGQSTRQMLLDVTTQIVPAYNSSRAKNVLIAVEITNDMHVEGRGVKEAIDSMKKYVTITKAAGFKVYVKKQYCRGAPGTGPGKARYATTDLWNLAVDSINAMLDTNAVHADGILPVDATHFIKRSDYVSNAAYTTAVTALLAANFYDGVHLLEIGYQVEADLDYAVIAPEFAVVFKIKAGDTCFGDPKSGKIIQMPILGRKEEELNMAS